MSACLDNVPLYVPAPDGASVCVCVCVGYLYLLRAREKPAHSSGDPITAAASDQ